MSMRRVSDATQLNAASLAMLPTLVQQWLPDGEQRGAIYVARNPLRNDRNLGSFQINTSTGLWRDHAIGKGGRDAISLYAYLHTDGDYRAARTALADDPLIQATIASGAKAPAAKLAIAANAAQAKLPLIRRLYAQAVELHGMPAAAYLMGRGLKPTEAWEGLRASVLRYPKHGACPVLIAPIEALDGSLVGLHRTYLQPNGTKLPVANPRLTLGQVRGCAIRLGEVSDQLIICEGLEDGLTLHQTLDVPVWVACGAGLMRSMALPDTVSTLTIASDNDAPGELATQHAADVFGVGGRTVRIMRPAKGFKDFNDQLRGIVS